MFLGGTNFKWMSYYSLRKAKNIYNLSCRYFWFCMFVFGYYSNFFVLDDTTRRLNIPFPKVDVIKLVIYFTIINKNGFLSTEQKSYIELESLCHLMTSQKLNSRFVFPVKSLPMSEKSEWRTESIGDWKLTIRQLIIARRPISVVSGLGTSGASALGFNLWEVEYYLMNPKYSEK